MRRRRTYSFVLVAFLLLAAACHKSEHAAGFEGAWLGQDGGLLIEVKPSNDVVFYYVAGMGSCIDLATGTATNNAIVAEDGTRLPVTVKGSTLTLTDSSGSIGGVYRKVTLSSLCYSHVPAPGAMTSRGSVLVPSAAVSAPGGTKRRTVTFQVPAGTAALAFDIFGQDVGYEGIAITAFSGPTGGNLLNSEPGLEECFNGFCGIFLPKAPGYDPVAGTYTARIEGVGAIDDASLQVRLILRPGPIAQPTTIRVHPVVAPTASSNTEIQAALDGMKTALGAKGITLVLDPITNVADARFGSLVADFLHPITQELMATGGTDTVNLFFVDDMVGIDGLFGMSSGIPGSVGVVGPWNGTLVNLSQHRGSAGLVTPLLVETIVHEPGHLLGLYHTTESDGRTFDILPDTPECPATQFDFDRDGTMAADECAGVDGHNTMFWTPSTTNGMPLSQDVLTAQQVDVLSHTVIGQ